MAAGSHPFPFRTRQLSPPAPMVLGGRPPGRVGRRRVFSKRAPARTGRAFSRRSTQHARRMPSRDRKPPRPRKPRTGRLRRPEATDGRGPTAQAPQRQRPARSRSARAAAVRAGAAPSGHARSQADRKRPPSEGAARSRTSARRRTPTTATRRAAASTTRAASSGRPAEEARRDAARSPRRRCARSSRGKREAPRRCGRRSRARKVAPAPPAPRSKTTEATEELARLAGRDARGAQDQLARAAEAYAAGRERDALRLLRPLRDAYPDASAVRELLGLCHYRLGQYPAAAKELEAFVDLTDSVEQHPVLMDCMRAQGKYAQGRRAVGGARRRVAVERARHRRPHRARRVARRPRPGARRDRDCSTGAPTTCKRVQEHHLRLWYALADLYERAGEIRTRARAVPPRPQARRVVRRRRRAPRRPAGSCHTPSLPSLHFLRLPPSRIVGARAVTGRSRWTKQSTKRRAERRNRPRHLLEPGRGARPAVGAACSPSCRSRPVSTGRRLSVPVAVLDPPAWVEELDAGDEIVVVGPVRRRFFRAAGATASRVEIEADVVAPARDRRRLRHRAPPGRRAARGARRA